MAGGAAVSDRADLDELSGLIDQQADRLTRLVNNLLDMTRIQSGALEVRPKQMTIANLVDEATTSLRSALGDQLVSAVGATVESISKRPRRFPTIYRNRRRAFVRRFPYGIIFEVQEQRIVVIACFHYKRNPKRWRLR